MENGRKWLQWQTRAVKRLMKEAQELQEATETYYAHPLEDNLFEWHFTIRGPEDTEFEGGIYHGRIILPPEYPMKPPSIILLTPNGRFEIFKKICLSISGHHPESWQPSWSIRTALLAIIGFMPTHGNGAIGSLDYTPDERKVLAKRSLEFKCSDCGPISTILKPVTEASKESNREAKELAQQINFQAEKEKKGTDKENKALSPATESGAGSAETATDGQQQGATGAPPAQMPGFPVGFPPFMQQAFRPPATSGTNIPPQFFMPPPFWPGGGQQQPNSTTNPRMPVNPYWPPGFMMPPGMAAVPPAANAHMPDMSATASLHSPAVSQPTATSPPQTQPPAALVTSASSAIPGTEEKSAASSSSRNDSQQNPVSSSSPSDLLSSSSATSSTSSTSSNGSTSTTTTTTEATVRRRQVEEAVSDLLQHRPQPQPAVRMPQQQYERLARRQSSGGFGCIGVLMVLIGLALAFLIIRRMYIMNLLDFDFNF